MSAQNDSPFTYIGTELDIFSKAENWKSHWGSKIRGYLGREILEVGAGLGANTRRLAPEPDISRWVCLEPDEGLFKALKERIGRDLPEKCSAIVGTLIDLPADELFDSLLYIDVLEHIERDAEELSLAAEHLRPGGHLVVLVPAHQFLYTPFDKAIGHVRRYNKRSLLNAASKSGLRLISLCYLDSIGILASLANRLFLKDSMPTERQILFWDSVLVRASMIADPLLGYNIGKSVLGVWQKSI